MRLAYIELQKVLLQPAKPALDAPVKDLIADKNLQAAKKRSVNRIGYSYGAAGGFFHNALQFLLLGS
jgi:hypothetical protein